MAFLPPASACNAAGEPLPGYDPYSCVLHAVIAKEIREVIEKIESLAGVMVADEHFTSHYMEQLQDFDYLVQHAEECANLLDRIAQGEQSLAAISQVRLGAVQERLRAALNGE